MTKPGSDPVTVVPRDEPSPRLVAKGVGVRFGDVRALHRVTYSFGGRGVTGLIGVNGAGKTTLIHSLVGLLPVTTGDVFREGGSADIAFCPDTPTFEPWFTATEVLVQSALLGRRTAPPVRDRTDGILERVGLGDHADRRVGGFSRGMRQRLGIAAALVRDPAILLLDEPTSALDPVGREDVMELVTDLGRDLLVIFSSHLLDDVERVADSLVVLHRGVVRYSGPIEDFRRRSRPERVLLTLTREGDGVLEALADRGVTWTRETDEETRITLNSVDLPTALAVLQEHPGELVAVERKGGSLQAAFLATLRSITEAEQEALS